MKKFSLLLLLLSLSSTIFAQKKSKSTINSSLKYEYDSVLYTNLKYREIGPFRGGRSAAVVGDLKEKNT